MPQISPYARAFSFQDFQTSHPSTPLPGDKVDGELDSVATVTAKIRDNLSKLQRDDLALANKLVGYDQLADELRNGFTTPTVWAASTAYGKGAGVYVGRKVYAALSAHTSGSSFNVDLTAGKWYLLADFTAVTTVDQTASEAAALAVSSASAAATSAGNSQTSATAAAASESAAADSAAAAEAAQTAIEAAQDKLDSIEEGADVTDAANVAAAGAVMVSAVPDDDDLANSGSSVARRDNVAAAIDTLFDAPKMTIIRGGHILTPYDRVLTNPVHPNDPWDAEVDVAISELAGEVGSSWSSDRQAFDASFDLASRSWVCAQEQGIVGVKQPGIRIQNGQIFSKAINKIAWNLGDCNHPDLENFRVYGYPLAAPACLVYFGVANTGSGLRASPGLKADKWKTHGKATLANVINCGSEVSYLGAHYHENRSRNVNALLYAGIADSIALAARFPTLTSDLVTLPGADDRLLSNICHTSPFLHMQHAADFNLSITGIDLTNPMVIHCDPAKLLTALPATGNKVFFQGLTSTYQLNGKVATLGLVDTDAGTVTLSDVDGTTGYDAWAEATLDSGIDGFFSPQSGECMYLEGAGMFISLGGGYLLSQGKPAVIFDMSHRGVLRNIQMRFQVEAQAPSIAHFILGDTAATLQHLEIDALQAAQSMTDAFFTKEGSGLLHINKHVFDLTSMPAVPPNGIWRDAAGGQSTIDIADATWTLPSSSVSSVVFDDIDPYAGNYHGFAGEIKTLADKKIRVYGGPRETLKKVSVAGTALTGSTSETLLATITIPAGIVPANGKVKGRCVFSMTGTAGTKTGRVKLAGTVAASLTSLATSLSMAIDWEIENRNDQASQLCPPGNFSGDGVSTNSVVTMAKNMALSQDITLYGQLANSADSLTLESYSVEIFRPN